MPRWLEAIVRGLIEGPDPVHCETAPTVLETLLPWPVRLLVVVAAVVIGRTWCDNALGQQLAWGVSYAALVALSLAVSFWPWIAFGNLSLALLWLALTQWFPLQPRADNSARWWSHQVVTFLNRQAGHIEALGTWTIIALTIRPELDVQLPLVAAIHLLAEPLLNGLVRHRLRKRGVTDPDDGTLHWERRPFIYGATVLGLVVLAASSWDSQFIKLVPLMVAVLVAGVLPRAVRHRLRNARVRAAAGSAESERMRREFRSAHMQWARRADVGLGPGLVLGALTVLVGLSWQARRAHDEELASALEGTAPGEACLPEPGGPVAAAVSLFLVADTQIHELDGERFTGQTELADAFVPVAVRPVELDMLSAGTMVAMSSLYHELSRQKARALSWSHLGDVADLSCRGELERALRLFEQLPEESFAGLAPGNHDMSFTGNFHWSPFWSDACRSGRLDKLASGRRLRDLARPLLERQGRAARGRVALREGGLDGWIAGRGGSLAMVSLLGVVADRDGEHGLMGVYVDTTDGEAFDGGVAGVFGSFSAEQSSTLEGMIQDLRGRGQPYDDPLFVVFSHHPLGSLTSKSRQRFEAFLDGLDRGQHGTPRLLALVSAHTHRAETHWHCLGKRRLVRELVVGSAIDAPQQAALLEVGPDSKNQVALRLTNLPVVARPGRSCDPPALISATDCRRVVAALAESQACEPLFESHRSPPPDCAEVERSLELRDRIAALQSLHVAADPATIRERQERRAEKLLACICRPRCSGAPSSSLVTRAAVGASTCAGAGIDRACADWQTAAGDNPFAGERYQELFETLAREPGMETELACLSWAASAVQQHKAAGMTMAEALRCAFDDPSLAAAQQVVATLRERPCP